MKYKAVIFDLFGTLVYNSSPSESNQVLRQMARTISIPDDDFIKMWLIAFEDRMKGVFKSYQECILHICRQTNTPVLEEKIERAADLRSGAYSILTGVAANHSMMEGKEIKIADLVNGIGYPNYPEMPSRTGPLPMPPKG